MYFIVETDKNLEKLQDLCNVQGAYLEVITSNDNYHPKLTSLVAVYIRPLYEEEDIDPINGNILGTIGKGYIVPICHDESQGVVKEYVQELISNTDKNIYVLNKKNALYHFTLGKNVIDLNLKYSMNHYDRLDSNVLEKTCGWYYNRYGGYEEINQVIPISKIYERCESVFEKIKFVIEEPEPSGFNFYNELATKAFFLVEQNGLRVDIHDFEERFKPLNSDYSVDSSTGLVYTSYNLYNSTSRPTNAFNSVNFLAIPKGKEYRRCFKPQNDRFCEFDFESYHVRLVADLVKYELKPDTKAHRQVAEMRLGRPVTDEEYKSMKADNFKMIYGTPSESDQKLEFSQKIQEYINSLWKQYNHITKFEDEEGKVHQKADGKIYDPNSKKAFTKELKDMYPNKLFNYLIQSVETSRNVLILCKVLGFMARYHAKSKIVLITYDSFLVDYSESDGPELLDGIRKIMSGEPEHRVNETPIFPLNIHESLDLNFE